MNKQSAVFEIEIRCHFDEKNDAYEALPFLHSSLQHEMIWTTTFYGLEMFKSGRLLRASSVESTDKEKKVFLGWKGPDIGEFANIRQEIDEDITYGTVNSQILKLLGGQQKNSTPQGIIQQLERLGHRPFMSFDGKDFYGRYEPFGINVKLMTCPVLNMPLLVEIEKMATTEKEAIQCQQYLCELYSRFQLGSRLIREEPPSLLYNTLFNHNPK